VADPATFADRALWSVDQVDQIELRGPGRDGDLVRDGANWILRRPNNVDLDPERAAAVASWLAHPRVPRWGADAGSCPPKGGAPGGGTHPLELAAPTDDTTAVRSADRPGAVGVIDSRVARGLLAVFGS